MNMTRTAVKDRVLVIEDDRTTRTMIGRMLTKRSYEVMGADNGIIGYEKAATENPDLILLDVMMPEMDGLELLSNLKANDDTRSIPVVLLTWRDRLEDLTRAFEEGASGYILKPVTGDDLEDTINRVMADRQAASVQVTRT